MCIVYEIAAVKYIVQLQQHHSTLKKEASGKKVKNFRRSKRQEQHREHIQRNSKFE